ncbi:MAG TPA: hypothetical protein VGD40_19235 [Chryseosolibacter sp.]
MKNKIIIGAVLFILSLASAYAQDINASITASFEKNFAGATNIRWTPCPKKISLAQFGYMGKAWLAYFDHQGKLVSSGRRLTIHELPVVVQNGLRFKKQLFENKYGAIATGTIYEMLTDNITEYYIPLQNHKIRFMIAVQSNGTVIVKSKKKLSDQPKSPEGVLARQN